MSGHEADLEQEDLTSNNDRGKDRRRLVSIILWWILDPGPKFRHEKLRKTGFFYFRERSLGGGPGPKKSRYWRQKGCLMGFLYPNHCTSPIFLERNLHLRNLTVALRSKAAQKNAVADVATEFRSEGYKRSRTTVSGKSGWILCYCTHRIHVWYIMVYLPTFTIKSTKCI